MDKLLNTEEIGKFLNVSRATVYRLIDKGMPSIKVAGTIRFEVSEVMKWIKENQ